MTNTHPPETSKPGSVFGDPQDANVEQRRRGRLARAAYQLAIIFAFWTATAMAYVLSACLRHYLSGEPVDFRATASWVLAELWLWAALTPLVFWLSNRSLFERGRLARAFLLQCLFFAVVFALKTCLAQLLHFPLMKAPGFRGPAVALRGLESFYSDLWMYGTLVVVWNFIESSRKRREYEVRAASLEGQLVRAQLEALRSQLQPHFLFNTLNSISALMQDEPEAAEDILADLSALLRASLDGDARQEIPLSRELLLLETYLRIQKRRFENLRVTIKADPASVRGLVPTLLLQPIAENAVRHGISRLRDSGLIAVTTAVVHDKLVISVSDNGPGMAGNYKPGIGLQNTRARLVQLYGEEQEFELKNNDPQGATVRIVLPYRPAPPQIGENYEDQDVDRRRRTAGEAAGSVIARE